MRAADLPIPAPAASPAANAMPPAASEAPRGELGGGFEDLLEAIAPPPLDAEQPEAESPLAALLVPTPVPSEEAVSIPVGAPVAQAGAPAPEQDLVAPEIGRPAPESPFASAARPEPRLADLVHPEPGEGMAAAGRNAVRAPVAQQQSSGAADPAALPVPPEAADLTARPTPELTRPPESQAGSRSASELPATLAAPARTSEEGARPDTATPDGGERRDGTGARPEAGTKRAGGEDIHSDPRTPPFEPAHIEAPKAGGEAELRDPRAALLRSERGAERAPGEPLPEAASPLPRATPLVPGATPSEPSMAPALRAPAAGTPAEALPLHAEWLAARGGGTARIRLHPPELGEVELSVRVRGSRVQVSIQTEQAEAGRAALDGRELLVEALASRELRVEQLVVRSPEGVTTTATPGDSGDGSSEHLSGEPEGSSERDESRPQSHHAASQPEPPPDDPQPAFGSAVDLRV